MHDVDVGGKLHIAVLVKDTLCVPHNKCNLILHPYILPFNTSQWVVYPSII